MVVVAEEKRVSSAPEYLSGNKILSVCNSANQLMKENPKEKVRRISFLHELNAACNLSMEDRAKNWNLFLNVHGTQIQSKEEYELWWKIIYGEQASGKAKEDIPVMELTLLCLDCLKECLPDSLETLYSYRPASFLHQGGFSKFLEQYPNVLKECVERIQQKDWTKYRRRYLQEWARLECDQEAIRALCNVRAALIRWGSISKGLNREFEAFCRSGYTKKKLETVTDKTIMENVQELKSLLVETSFRRILNREAAVVLAKQAEKWMNKASDYKIFLADVSWL